MTNLARTSGQAFGILGLVAAAVLLSGMTDGRIAAETTTSPAPRWPLRIESEGDRITFFEPQFESFMGDTLTGRAAVSIVKAGQTAPTFGAAWLECTTSADRVNRTLRIVEMGVTRARFPGGGEPMEAALTRALRKELLDRPMTLSLDAVVASVARTERERATGNRLRNDPPRIVYRSHPAVKVQYDGKPVLREAAGSNLMRVINTPFLVVLDPDTRTYYLKGAGRWFQAPDPLGPFQDVPEVPAPVRALAAQEGYKDPEAGLSDAAMAGVEIVTATEPTELIWTDGGLAMAPIAGTDLLYVTNTGSNVFLDIPSRTFYVLLSGRWFASKTWDGLWAFVPPDKLPVDFRKIPPGSEKGAVLAHVAGTAAAENAVLDSRVPQVGAIDRNLAQKPSVTYDGDPRFKPVENTKMRYAENTASSVLEVGDRYYCCFDATWYEAPTPTGPWEVCVRVPPEIYDMPPSCPLYATTFVHVYDVTPDVVYTGYLPGYVGSYPYGGTVVYGTGYGYPGWCGSFYDPWPCTFGYGACFDPFWGTWGFDVCFGAPVFWLGRHCAFDRCGWWGCGGFRPAFTATAAVNVSFASTVGGRAARFDRASANPALAAGTNPGRTVFDRRTDVRRDLTASPSRAPERTAGIGNGRPASGLAGTPRAGDTPASRFASPSAAAQGRHEGESAFRGAGRDGVGNRSGPPSSRPSSPSSGIRSGGSTGSSHSGSGSSSGGGFRGGSGFRSGGGSGGSGFRGGGGGFRGGGGGFRGGGGGRHR